jgi:ABC-2 type transport system permease protein
VTSFPSTVRLVVVQTRYQLISFGRIPVAVFFTLGLPLIMLVLFNALFGDGVISTPEGDWTAQQFYTGGLAAFTAVSATFTNLANMVPIRRDEGVLKRWRGTPLPTWIYIAGFIVSAVIIAFAGVVLMLTLGVVVYDLEIELGEDAGGVRDVPRRCRIVRGARYGVGCRGEDGELGVGGGERDHPAVGVRLEHLHPGRRCAAVDRGDRGHLPAEGVRRVVPGLLQPVRRAARLQLGDLAFIAAWGALGLVVALTRFTWEPSGSAPRGRRSRRAAVAATTD